MIKFVVNSIVISFYFSVPVSISELLKSFPYFFACRKNVASRISTIISRKKKKVMEIDTILFLCFIYLELIYLQGRNKNDL